jgi:hypothetical protein
MSRSQSAVGLVCSLLVGTACSGSSTPADSGAATWWVEAQKAVSSGAVYGIGLDPVAAVAFLPSDQPQPTCAVLSPLPDAGDADAWFVVISLGVPASGTTAPIGGSWDSATSSHAAVGVYHREPTQSAGWTAWAVSGQLGVASSPANSTDFSTPFAGHVTALFPDDPVSTVDCQAGTDGGPGACECQYVDGGAFSCGLPVDAGSTTCCDGDGGSTSQNHQLSFDFSATGCSGT